MQFMILFSRLVTLKLVCVLAETSTLPEPQAFDAGSYGPAKEDRVARRVAEEVATSLREDPLVLTFSLLLVMYLIGSVMLKSVKSSSPVEPAETTEISRPKGEAPKRSRGPKLPWQRAVAINQQFMALNTPDEVLACAMTRLGQMDTVNVVTAIHRSTKLALAKKTTAKLAADPRVATLLEQLQGLFEAEMPVHILTRAVGNTSWALGKMGYTAEGEGESASIFLTLRNNFVRFADHFKAEELMNTVWAFAELCKDAPKSSQRQDLKGEDDHALAVAKAALGCLPKFPEFTLQQMVYCTWALARFSANTSAEEHADEELETALGEFKDLVVARVSPAVDSLTTKNLAMLSWAAAHLGKVKSGSGMEPLLLLIVRTAEERGFDSFHPGELASITWSLSKCVVSTPRYFKLFRDYTLSNRFRGFSCQDIANVLCAYVSSESGDAVYYEALRDQVEKHAARFNRIEKSMVSWAFQQIPDVTPPRIGS